jgi:RNA polymerase sigma-70 factor, ECF subfamily
LNTRPAAAKDEFFVDAPEPAQKSGDERSDLELIAAINGGDAAAFEVLYFRYRDWVVRLAHRITGDSDMALDVMQETFLYFLRKFPGFRLTANLKTFLYPAVRNLAIAARQKTGRYQTTERELERIENAAAPEHALHGAGDLAVVLAGLSEEHREVLLLRFVDGLTLGEIAEAAEIPLGTVKSRLHNAVQQLRNDERTREYFKG